jgi:hypothetical protein
VQPYALDRTYPLARDLDWLPRRVRAMRWTVAGSVWGATGLALAGMVAVAPVVAAGMWKPLGLAGVGGALLGERAGHAAYRRHVRKLARGKIDLSVLSERDEGEFVHVRGRVQAERVLAGVLHGVPGVFRRLVFLLDRKKWVHEAALDFALIDDKEERVLVHAAGARLLVPTRELIDYPASRVERVPSLRVPGGAWSGPDIIPASEYVLPDGAEVEVVGHKTLTPDPTGAIHTGDYRLPPQRATLRSGKVLPLIITPVGIDEGW